MRSFDARIVIVLVIVMGTFLRGAAGQTVASPPQTQPSTVVVLATVEAFWSADQYAKTAGYVSEVKHDIGDQVKKGELLAL